MFNITSITPHPQIKKIFEARLKSIENGEVDFATAE